jgi:hypothetical protein
VLCAKAYSGEQAQRICQYELGQSRRRLEWEIEEDRKQAVQDAEQDRIRRKAADEAEAEKKVAVAQAKEQNAKNCIASEFSEIRNILKKTRDISRTQNGKNLITSFDENHFDTDYVVNFYIPGIKSLPEEFRPTLSKTARVIKIATSCDSDAMYYGYKVSLDGKTVDGFLAFRNWNNRPDNVDWWEEINDLEWLGPKISAEIKRLKALKAEEDRLKLEKSQADAIKKAEVEAAVKADNAAHLTFAIWFILGLIVILSLSVTLKLKNSTAKKLIISDKTKAPEQRYIFVPATNHQIKMQNAFRAKNPFVAHNVRFEHMARFIEGCIKHEAENGYFPSKDEQHQILLKLGIMSKTQFESQA